MTLPSSKQNFEVCAIRFVQMQEDIDPSHFYTMMRLGSAPIIDPSVLANGIEAAHCIAEMSKLGDDDEDDESSGNSYGEIELWAVRSDGGNWWLVLHGPKCVERGLRRYSAKPT